MSTVRGRFDKTAGKITLGLVAKTGSVDVSIDTGSITTGAPKAENGMRSRDEHLRSVDFFNVAEFPTMNYKSTKLNFKGEMLESVDGNLTLLGVTKPVRLTVTAFKCGTNPMMKKDMCGADAVAKIKRSDFGMKTWLPMVGDDITVLLNVEAYKTEEACRLAEEHRRVCLADRDGRYANAARSHERQPRAR
jgi:polyisoprenoid-binding protein YceI